jgi:hypothetical protein
MTACLKIQTIKKLALLALLTMNVGACSFLSEHSQNSLDAAQNRSSCTTQLASLRQNSSAPLGYIDDEPITSATPFSESFHCSEQSGSPMEYLPQAPDYKD